MEIDYREPVREYLQLHAPGAQLRDDEDIFAAGLVNSLFAVQLVMWVERSFRVTVQGDDLDIANFSSVDAVAAFIASRGGTRQNA